MKKKVKYSVLVCLLFILSSLAYYSFMLTYKGTVIKLQLTNLTKLNLSINEKKTSQLINDYGIIFEKTTFDFATNNQYTPDLMIIQFESLDNYSKANLIQTMTVNGKKRSGFAYEKVGQNALIRVFIDDEYINSLERKRKEQEINAIVVRAIVTIGKISSSHQSYFSKTMKEEIESELSTLIDRVMPIIYVK